jgi:uncharacterized membrane-anchored protein
MNRLVALLERIPLFMLFAGAAVLQIVLVSLMVFDRMQILREGTEITLQTRPIDPRDFLRGDYVRLGYNMSVASGTAFVDKQGGRVFVKLTPKGPGDYDVVSVHKDRPAVAAPDIVLQGRTLGGCFSSGCQNAISYGLERYFVPQGEGREIESARNQGKVSIVAAVTPSGRAAIKRLLIDGKPVYDEPLF